VSQGVAVRDVEGERDDVKVGDDSERGRQSQPLPERDRLGPGRTQEGADPRVTEGRRQLALAGALALIELLEGFAHRLAGLFQALFHRFA